MGLRDFYHLIKNAVFYLIESNNKNPEEEINIIEKSIKLVLKDYLGILMV